MVEVARLSEHALSNYSYQGKELASVLRVFRGSTPRAPKRLWTGGNPSQVCSVIQAPSLPPAGRLSLLLLSSALGGMRGALVDQPATCIRPIRQPPHFLFISTFGNSAAETLPRSEVSRNAISPPSARQLSYGVRFRRIDASFPKRLCARRSTRRGLAGCIEFRGMGPSEARAGVPPDIRHCSPWGGVRPAQGNGTARLRSHSRKA